MMTVPRVSGTELGALQKLQELCAGRRLENRGGSGEGVGEGGAVSIVHLGQGGREDVLNLEGV